MSVISGINLPVLSIYCESYEYFFVYTTVTGRLAVPELLHISLAVS